MLSGIGVLILCGQLHVLVDERPRENAVKNIAANYETMGMVTRDKSSKMPRIIKLTAGHGLGWTLVAHLKDGTKRFYRIECDIQPSVPHFPHIGIVPPPGPPGNPPHNPPRCHVKPKPYDPEHTYVWSWKQCRWVPNGSSTNDGSQHQPMQQDAGNQGPAQSQAPEVPSTAPSPHTTQPADTSSPSDSTSDGTDGGGSTQPGQSGSPAPGPSQSPAPGDDGGF